ncbi:hypothetical protein GJW-30_1_02071 [Variibacter gotjawalensis]|uniref:Uncharacterized protein n=1 Tax=Variibacter gotjawalensis TaxID=1333996 RepID=A0A0S3PUH5_9BRAD|nr:hypothetical protein [Variibacter gotjawalensis]NIK49863.1 hypothetical protein [Variibacter gotjawalensis]RZS45862.1 hypothetical protein EV661_4188 [Variibacter gotjawalensis]BAT59538.1 hypothetical protein GJW-30_1_02071 [Variibacter gotjawalensis]
MTAWSHTQGASPGGAKESSQGLRAAAQNLRQMARVAQDPAMAERLNRAADTYTARADKRAAAEAADRRTVPNA